MAEPIVVNTGPLVSFARIGCLDLIGRLPYEFLSPAEVWQELDEGRASGHPWAAPAWLKKKPLVTPPSPALLAGLDLGEAAVIQLALDLGVRTVAIDEWKGRRGALASGDSLLQHGSGDRRPIYSTASARSTAERIARSSWKPSPEPRSGLRSSSVVK